jgi:membrane associated rhomboid family serine protease
LRRGFQETNQLDWLRKAPIVSLLIASAMIAVPFIMQADFDDTGARFENARDEARNFVVHNPQLAVDALGTLILDPEWLDEARAAAEASNSSTHVELPTRMLARSQAKLDRLVDLAYAARMRADPAWRLGVLDARTPASNYFAHAFIHEAIAGVILCVAVLFLVGAPLERSWGSAVFAVFSLVAIPLTAQGYRLLDGGTGVPWSGSAGLAGALLGAYFIRGLGGQFVVPGWVLLPIWLGVESLVVRNFWIDDLGSVPWASFCAAVGFGSLVAGALRLVGVESALESFGSSSRGRNGPNPVISRAARLRSDGDPYQAFDLIQAAWRDSQADQEVAEAFFAIAVEVGQSDAAAEAILPSLHEAVRAGDMPRALNYWIPVATSESDVKLETTAAVRLGEALLDAGHPQQAIFTLRGALDVGVSSAHALRIVKVARDLDEGLAREAAAIALADRTLDPDRRSELEMISSPPAETGDPGLASDESNAAVSEASPDLLARRVAAEHQSVEPTVFPQTSPVDSDETAETLAEPSIEGDLASNNENESQIIEQNLDPSALSPESFDDEGRDAPGETKFLGAESGDVLSHWNDPSQLGETIADIDGDLRVEEEASGDDIDLFGESFDLAGPDELNDPLESETDADMTPLMEASEELTSPFAGSAPADELTMLASTPGPATAGTDPSHEVDLAMDDQPTVVSPRPVFPMSDTPPLSPDPSDTVVASPAFEEGRAKLDEFAIGIESPPADEGKLRALKAVEAVPIELHEECIDIDVQGRGKSRLPIARIEAIVVAGISGLASRPILLVDFALNWMGDPSEPLKVIRFRSDRFDPRSFEPGEMNPLEALTAWVRRLQIRSQATCLPSRSILDGHFVRYDSVEDYESEVLAAMREV